MKLILIWPRYLRLLLLKSGSTAFLLDLSFLTSSSMSLKTVTELLSCSFSLSFCSLFFFLYFLFFPTNLLFGTFYGVTANGIDILMPLTFSLIVYSSSNGLSSNRGSGSFDMNSSHSSDSDDGYFCTNSFSTFSRSGGYPCCFTVDGFFIGLYGVAFFFTTRLALVNAKGRQGAC